MQFGMQYSSEPSTLESARATESALRLLDGNIHHGIKSVWVDGELLYSAYAVFLNDDNAPILDGCRRVVLVGSLAAMANAARAKMEQLVA